MKLTKEEFDIFQIEFQQNSFNSFVDIILTNKRFSKLKTDEGFANFFRNYIIRLNAQKVLDFIEHLRFTKNNLVKEISGFNICALVLEINAYAILNNHAQCKIKVSEVKKLTTDRLIIGETLNALANVYFVNKFYTEAYIIYTEILLLFETVENDTESSMKGMSLLNLSLLFESIEDIDKMLIYMEKADKILSGRINSPMYSQFLLTKANVYYYNNQINEDEALEIIAQIEKLTIEETKVEITYLILYKIDFLLRKNDLIKANDLIKKLNQNFSSYSVSIKQDIIIRRARYLYLKGDYENFTSYMDSNIDEINKSTTLEIKNIISIIEKYIEVQDNAGNYKKSSEYYKILIQKKFDIVKTNSIIKLSMAEARNNIKKKNEELEIQKINTQKIEELNNKLLNKNKELEYFAGMAAHDIRSPVRTINSIINIIKTDENLNEDLRELMKTVDSSSKRIYTLVDDLLRYSSSGNFPKVEKAVNFIHVLELVKQNISALIFENSAKINFLTSLPELMIHESALIVVFQNIISNAIKFRKENTHPIVNISGKRENGFCNIYIEDNGKGISKENLEKIFKPFLKLTSNNNNEGSGLGLATCFKIIDNFKGKISVESKINEGTCFKISFPTETL